MLSGLGHGAHGARNVVETVLGPWGGSAAAIDTYESAIRAATEAQLGFARIVDVQPARWIAVVLAELTRDIGAVQVAGAPWVLDV
jgi:hypothetical protein